ARPSTARNSPADPPRRSLQALPATRRRGCLGGDRTVVAASASARAEPRRSSRRGDATRTAAGPGPALYEAGAGAAWSRIFPGRFRTNHGVNLRGARIWQILG